MKKFPATPPGIDPETFRLVAQCLNHYATSGPVTIPVAPVTNGIIIHFIFHIRCIFVHTFLHFSLFVAFFCVTFMAAVIAASISVHVFSCLFLIIISGAFAITSLYIFLDTKLLSSSSSSPLFKVFTLIFLRQTMSLDNTVLQPFCCSYSWCIHR
jgi:hypothetical protein